jgi:hypothetical protein
MILKDERVLPYLGDRRSDVTAAINTVNLIRRDAHARVVPDDEFSAVCQAFEILEGEFSSP